MERNKILLIDMYGVIIKESKGYFVPYTLQKLGVSAQDRMKRIIKDEQCFTKAQRGELTSEEFLSYLGYACPQAAMEEYLKSYLTLDEGFREFAEKYSKIYAFCLLSNDVLEWSEFLTGYHRINHYFMDKIVSGQVHLRKPDKEIFTYTLKRLGCNPEQCIFIDNSIKNLLVAEELGIQTILFNRDGVQYEGRSVADFDALGRILEGMWKNLEGENYV